MPSNLAPLDVAAVYASAGVIPALTNHPSSRVFSPNIEYTASDPIANFTPALNARLAVSRLRTTNALSLSTDPGANPYSSACSA